MDKLFLFTLNMSLNGSAVIMVIFIARMLLKKAPKSISYLLWAVAAFRLVIPFSFEGFFSLIPFKQQPIPVDIAYQSIPKLDSGIVMVDGLINSFLPSAPLEASQSPLQILIAIGAYIWLLGAVLFIGYALISYVLLKIKMKSALCLKENIYESQKVKSPFVLGLLSPKIYLPLNLSDKEIMFIVSHEKAHLKRRDNIIKFAAYLILCLHWFNPFVWAAFYLMSKDMEMSCDERVLKELGTKMKSDYSRTLLALASQQHILSGSPLAFGEGGIKARIKNILNFKKPAFWVVAASAACCILVAVCLLTNPSNDNAANIPTVSASQPQKQAPPILTKETAAEFINNTLSTFKLGSDDTVSFKLPEQIPVDESADTRLFIYSNASFAPEPGTGSVQDILDMNDGWKGGESFTVKLDMSKGKLTRVFLRVAFITVEGENSYKEYAANYIEFLEPFAYDTTVNVIDKSVKIEAIGTTSVLNYTLQNGDKFSITLTMPNGVSLSPTDNYPDYTKESYSEMPPIVVVKDKEPAGIITLASFGTNDIDSLAKTNTSENTIPLTIFAPIALSNHAQFENYKVCNAWETGASATADYLWQDLTDYGGRAPEAPWLTSQSVLAYDYNKIPFFISISLADGSLTAAELEALAKSMEITN